ncbi:MAG TPA: TonB-dependent receptor [Rhizomicrobium sp.]
MLALLTSSVALAQTEPSVGTSDSIETVTVTGSRVSTAGFQSPTPVTVLGEKSLGLLGNTALHDLEYSIPALAPNVAVVSQSGNPGLSTFNLRNLGPTRTLVLMNGMRAMPSEPTNNTVDANLLPAILISNVNVVTGGASAAYGSDAVAGVVNLTIDNNFVGLKGNFQAGMTEYSDYQNLDGSIAYGTNFGAGDKGHFEIAGDWYVNNGVCCQTSRPWDKAEYGLVANPNPNTLPHNFVSPNTRLATENPGGIITSNGPLKGLTFAPDGTPSPFQYGSSVGSIFMIGGDPRAGDFARYGNISNETARITGYASASYQIAEDLAVNAEVMVGRSNYYYAVIPNIDPADITITRDNAFLNSSIRATMIANGLNTFTMGRTNEDFGPKEGGQVIIAPVFNTHHMAVGANGKLSDWTWKAFVQYNSDTMADRLYQDKNLKNFALAVDSVVSPTTGQPVCRATLTNPSNGCVPINLFGFGAPSQAALNYVTGTSVVNETETELDAGIDVQGAPFSTWAGPVSVASGFEWRREAQNGSQDAVTAALGYYNETPAIAGSYTVAEGYLETVVPLATDLSWAKNLEVDLAGRITGYSTSGITETWKVGVNYTPLDDQFRIRGTWSHDIRAPNLSELFQPRTLGLQTVLDPVTGQQTVATTVNGGNPLLLPEQANNLTGGFVYAPDWLPGFQASIDYFGISVHGAINTLAPQQVVNNCYQANLPAYCSQIVRNPGNGGINSVTVAKFNFQTLETDGADIEASYSFAGEDLWKSIPGNFTVRMLGNYVEHLQVSASGQTLEYAGQDGSVGTVTPGLPHFRSNLTTVWDWAPFTVQADLHYIQGGTLNNAYILGVDISQHDGHVANRTYLDISGTYDYTDHLQLFGKMANVLDTAPPLTPTNILKPLASGSPLFDQLGRSFALGVRVKF